MVIEAAAVVTSGLPARLLAVGVDSVAGNSMTLAAHHAPPGQLEMFLVQTMPVNALIDDSPVGEQAQSALF